MRTVALKEVASPGGLVGGPFGSNLVSSDYVDQGIPVIRGENLGVGKWVGGEFVFVTPEKAAADLARNLATPGDLVFTQRGTLGQAAVVPSEDYREYVISQSQMRLRADPTIADVSYVYYACNSASFIKQIHDRAIATGVPHINLGILAELSIPLPGVEVQRAIAEVLGALDDKIAANAHTQRINSTLAETAFRRVQAMASRTCTLRELVTLEYGKALPATARRAGCVNVYGSGGVVGSHDEALCKGPGIVVGRKGTVGAVYWAPRDFYPIDTVFYARPLGRTTSEYAYFVLKGLPLGELNSDSAVPGLNRNEAYAQVVQVATDDAIAEFTEVTRVLFARSVAAEVESLKLAELRDTLLPHLMSGRLTVRQAEAVVSDAL